VQSNNDTPSSPERSPRGIQSVEVGGQLLMALAHHGRPLALKDLARQAGMPPAKAHPYLVSFIKIGLVEQIGISGHYGLGPLALQLGLISLQQYDPVRLATPRIEDLAAHLGHTVAIAVWGNRGPTIVRVAEAASPVHVTMHHGTVMSLRGTASGRLFSAFMPADIVRAALVAEATVNVIQPSNSESTQAMDASLKENLHQVREQGIAHSRDGVIKGVSALAAPVFDDQSRIVLSLTAIGPSGSFDLDLKGATALALKSAGQELSRQLGWLSHQPE
jgi:DNA-binding IclR family transcriptional regulator